MTRINIWLICIYSWFDDFRFGGDTGGFRKQKDDWKGMQSSNRSDKIFPLAWKNPSPTQNTKSNFPRNRRPVKALFCRIVSPHL